MCYTKEGALKDRREMLKVKLKSLAEESRIIRVEERRTTGQLQSELNWHRRLVVRHETRATHLAYGIIRHRPLERIERPATPRTEEFWKKVRGMIERYGPCERLSREQMLKGCHD